jgi:kynurenine formamidase
MNIIDLSIPFKHGEDAVVKLQDNSPIYCGQECHAYDIEIRSHHGSYLETSSHVFRDGQNTDAIPLERLILPCMCIKFEEDHQCITAANLEILASDIKPHSALLINTGSDTTKYFSRDAAQWMAKRKVALMGSNTARYDTGFVNPTGFFIDLFKADIPIIANITNLHLLPRTGFTLIVLPLKISGICTVPCRIIAEVTSLISKSA